MHPGGFIEARALPESERLVERSLLVARREDSQIAGHPALPGRASAEATGQAAGVSSIPLCMRRRMTESKPANKSSGAKRTDPLTQAEWLRLYLVSGASPGGPTIV